MTSYHLILTDMAYKSKHNKEERKYHRKRKQSYFALKIHVAFKQKAGESSHNIDEMTPAFSWKTKPITVS